MFCQLFPSGFLPALSATACFHSAFEDGHEGMAADGKGHLGGAGASSAHRPSVSFAFSHLGPHTTRQAPSVTHCPIQTWASMEEVLRSRSVCGWAGAGVARSVR